MCGVIRLLTCQCLCQEVDRKWVRLRVQRLKRPLLAERHGADVVLGTARGDGVKLFDCWGAKHVEDERQLVVAERCQCTEGVVHSLVLSREDGLAA